jgi:hypothetical protein
MVAPGGLSRVRSRRVVAVVAVALLASCGGQEDCTVSGASCEPHAVTIVITPQRLALGVGDTASVAVSVTRGGRSVGSDVRWTAGQPPIMALDSLTVAQPRVRLRATAAGMSLIGLTVTVNGQQYMASVPVTITAR